VLPGNTADVSTVEKVRADLRGWDLGRAMFVADAGMNSEDNRSELAKACGKYLLACRMATVAEIKRDVLSKRGPYTTFQDNLEAKDDTISLEDAARGYKGLMVIERCFRTPKRTQIKMTPMYHWTSRRIETHVKIWMLALMIERIAERQCGEPWHKIRHTLEALQVTEFFLTGGT
jgi:transposase